jgi:dihydrofolate reductase
MISLIAAVADNNVIGCGLEIPWRLPEDMKLFKRLTLGSAVIMGKRTWVSLGRPLKERANIIVSRSLSSADGAIVVSSLEQALAEAAKTGTDVFIIGGRQLYEDGLEKADRLYLSRVHQSPQGDVFFPVVNWTDWILTATEEYAGFTFQEWKRAKSVS